MLFSSIPFLYYFLPIVFLVYFAVPKSFKNFVLLVASLFFYGWGEPKSRQGHGKGDSKHGRDKGKNRICNRGQQGLQAGYQVHRGQEGIGR